MLVKYIYEILNRLVSGNKCSLGTHDYYTQWEYLVFELEVSMTEEVSLAGDFTLPGFFSSVSKRYKLTLMRMFKVASLIFVSAL